ncbi:hypothetical protein DFJ73DRAFT_656128 [Zopfochytrium polystomum]|nr:hypothetical protein DFJ73DRAFT_656128 [Zopfochytrium polystomum]
MWPSIATSHRHGAGHNGFGGSCDGGSEEGGLVKVLLGAFITTGIMLSYIPQVSKLIKTKSSLGISVWFLLLGSIGGGATIGNIVIMQAPAVACCFTEWSARVCFENTLGITQVFTQFFCFHMIIVLFYVYFPKHHADPSDPHGHRNAAWREAVHVLYVIIAWLGLVVLADVIALHIAEDIRLGIATLFGFTGVVTSFIQFLPQIWTTFKLKTVGVLSIPTMAMQAPGSLLFVYSIYLQPGTNWTSWISFLAAGILQGVLLVMCLYFKHHPYEPLHREDAPERAPLLQSPPTGSSIVIEDDV